MLREEDDGSPAKCRERRRRRIEMRRFAALSAAGPPPPQYSFHSVGLGESSAESSALVDDQRKRFRTAEGRCLPSSSSTSSGDDVEARPTPPPPASALPPPPPPQVVAGTTVDGAEPAYGVMSVTGRSREMEDAVSVRTGLCFPEIDRRKPVHVFAVFDGHGGHHVARLCSEKMHVFVEEELMRVSSTEAGGDESVWREAMKRSFQRMDDVAMNTCACGGDGSRCGCHPLEVALGGSTAVVAALTCDRIVVANCGDSRAVLCRGGRAIPLSRDHKPDRPDELARIQAAGGRVIELNGARVEGILAMSRAIGDRYLKRVVISEPEITFTTREAADDCLILASDGLWDVLSVEMACEVACACLREGSPPPPPIIDINSGPPTEDEENRQIYPSRSMLAAALLTRLALGRRSLDNISVIVVDLKRS